VIEDAVAAVSRGWAVVPLHDLVSGACSCGRPDCPSPGKHPRVRWEPWQAQAPDVDRVRRWWQRWPNANIGVVTGAVSGVVVLDVDPRNGGDRSLFELERGRGPLPDTVQTETGGGGRHVWFRHPGGDIVSCVLAPGLELKGEGGLVVIPPSLHTSGRHYSWASGCTPENLPLAALPAWPVLLAGRVDGATDLRRRSADSVRTATERQAFADAWADLGIDLLPGDHLYLCPFHADHHPSLHIDADGCRWFCFGCRNGGGIVRLRRLSGSETSAPPGARLRGTLDQPVTLTGGIEVPVVGESWHQSALLALTGGRRRYGGVDLELAAELIPDPDDRFDPAAVMVVIEGQVVGHLPRAWARRLSPVVERARNRTGIATCRAHIRGGWDRGGHDVGFFGVTLDLADPGRSER